MSGAWSPVEQKVRDALVASGWPHPDVSKGESLLDLGLDSLGLALWVAELERHAQVKIPFVHLTMDRFETVEKAAKILESILKGLKT